MNNRIFNDLINNIKKNDINLLIGNYREDKLFDFKECISFEKLRINEVNNKSIIEKYKHDFSVDVASFANTSGGCLVFGLKEIDRVPSEIVPFEIDSAEKLEYLCGQIIRERIEPPLYGCQFKTIELEKDKYIFIVYIPKSHNSIHGVRKLGEDNYYFYGRNDEGRNYQFKLSEIKSYFILRDNMIEKMKKFRAQRIEDIIAGKTSIMLLNNPKIIMHIFPLSAFDSNDQFNIETFYKNSKNLCPIGTDEYRIYTQRNFDGILTYDRASDTGQHSAYIQLYRNGIIESVNSSIIRTRTFSYNPEQIFHILAPEIYEEQIVISLQRYMSALTTIDVMPPVYCALSFLGVKNYNIYYDSDLKRPNYLERSVPLDRDILFLPEFIIEDFSHPNLASGLLKNSFDLIHNACGIKESRNYVNDKFKFSIANII